MQRQEGNVRGEKANSKRKELVKRPKGTMEKLEKTLSTIRRTHTQREGERDRSGDTAEESSVNLPAKRVHARHSGVDWVLSGGVLKKNKTAIRHDLRRDGNRHHGTDRTS